MADDVVLDPGSGGDTIAADEIGGKKHQRVKVQHGADGSATDASAAAPLPVDDADTQTKLDTLIAALDGLEGMLDGVETLLAAATPAGTNNIGDVDVLTVPADPFGANADAAATAGSTGSIQAKLRLATSQLDAIKTAVEALDNAIAGSEVQVDVVTSALPSGAATSAKQDTIIGHVDGLEAKDFATQATLAAVLAAVDGLEAKDYATQTTLASVLTALDGVETLLDGLATSAEVQPAGGNVAHDSADSGNPLKTGGRARTALPAAVAQDDRTDTVTDKHSRTLVANAPIDQRTSGKATYSNTTAADLIAAPGANVAVVVTSVLVVNGHATVDTKVEVRDGTTVKLQGYAAADGGGFQMHDPDGLFVATVNTAVTGRNITTGADVDVFVAGFKVPA